MRQFQSLNPDELALEIMFLTSVLCCLIKRRGWMTQVPWSGAAVLHCVQRLQGIHTFLMWVIFFLHWEIINIPNNLPFTISFWGFHTDHRTHLRTTSWLHNFLMISPQSCMLQPFPLLCRYFHPQKIQRVWNTEVSKSISIASQNNLGGKKSSLSTFCGLGF